ncbi:hypothetical protein BHE74_00018435 [Ensete ventricosum]|nr:hypothetical protein BHE74_00018435 [Ensete ventricosum]
MARLPHCAVVSPHQRRNNGPDHLTLSHDAPWTVSRPTNRHHSTPQSCCQFEVGPGAATPSKSAFNFLSTSMAAPHVTGIMALIRKHHPHWSPSAIQSAIITSADDKDLDGNYVVDEQFDGTADVVAVGARIGERHPHDPHSHDAIISMLALPEHGNVFVLGADTSRVGIGVILMQDGLRS